MSFINKPLKIKIAYIISRIFEPVPWLLPLGIIILLSDHMDGHDRLIWSVVSIFFLALLPIITLFIMLKRGQFDIEMHNKEDRNPFFLAILFYWVLGLILIWSLSGPHLIFVLILTAIIIIGLAFCINLYWKISGHAMMITIVSFLINILYDWNYWWLFLFIPIVAWSRYVQKLHTLGQLIGGFFLGSLVFIIMKLSGY